MQTRILDGKLLSKKILTQLTNQISEQKLHPRLLILQVDNHQTSTQYINLKKKFATNIGAEVVHEGIPNSPNLELDIAQVIENYHNTVNGIMIQLPLPSNVSTEKILGLIPSHLDVDGLLLEKSPFPTAVAGAVCEIITTYIQDAKNKKILVIGNSPYVGGSIIRELEKVGHTNISVINEFTENNEVHMTKSEIIISCVGKPHIFKERQFSKNSIVIDVGTSSNNQGVIVGDVEIDFESGYLSAATPVPGGVGPVTVAILLKNLVENTKR